MKKKLIPLFLILAAGAGYAYYKLHGGSRDPEHRILISGNIEMTEVNIAFKTAGKLIERTVDEGDTVKKGQVIARLDRDQLLAQRAREVAALEEGEAQLAQAQTSVEWQRANFAGDIEQKHADV